MNHLSNHVAPGPGHRQIRRVPSEVSKYSVRNRQATTEATRPPPRLLEPGPHTDVSNDLFSRLLGPLPRGNGVGPPPKTPRNSIEQDYFFRRHSPVLGDMQPMIHRDTPSSSPPSYRTTDEPVNQRRTLRQRSSAALREAYRRTFGRSRSRSRTNQDQQQQQQQPGVGHATTSGNNPAESHQGPRGRPSRLSLRTLLTDQHQDEQDPDELQEEEEDNGDEGSSEPRRGIRLLPSGRSLRRMFRNRGHGRDN